MNKSATISERIMYEVFQTTPRLDISSVNTYAAIRNIVAQELGEEFDYRGDLIGSVVRIEYDDTPDE